MCVGFFIEITWFALSTRICCGFEALGFIVKMERCSLKHRRKVSEELSSPPSESPCLSGSFRKTPRTVCASRLDYLSKDSLVNKAGARGFLNLWSTFHIFFPNLRVTFCAFDSDIVLVAFLVWDPIMRYGETGTLIDLTVRYSFAFATSVNV